MVVRGNSNIKLTNQMYSVELTGLLPLAAYYYTVIATNRHGTNQSDVSSFNTTGIGPGAPVALDYTPIDGGAEYMFTWSAPNSTNNNVNINPYQLTCVASLRSIDPAPLPNLILPTNDNNTVVTTTLTPWAEYTCFVVASNQDGASPPSNSVFLTTPEAIPSGPPQQFFMSSDPSLGMVTFTWGTPPLEQRNGIITAYNVTCASGDHVVSLDVAVSPSNSYIVSGFRAISVYQCSVKAINSVGQGPPAVRTVTSGEDG